LGSGNQDISWIHLDDLCGMFIKAIEDNSINGPVNAVAPDPVTNRQLTRAIAAKLHKPMILPAVPSFALRLALGEMADIVLEGSKVSPKKIMDAGYHYQFKTLDGALTDLLN
jgi:NAD dependent epimerase/dehydratase family enzyme